MDDTDTVIEAYYPKGVQHIITTGGHHYIGFVDDTTVLKYPHIPSVSSTSALDVEAAIFTRLGAHPRIIGFKGKHEAGGLLLAYAANGSLKRHLETHKTSLSTKERLRFARETAEGVAHAHGKNVLVCDIHVRNVLLDADLHVKLCDLQGRILGADGEVVWDGGASENAEAVMPRSRRRRCCSSDKDDRSSADDEDGDDADEEEGASIKTDLFALGSTIYYILAGHRVFPELDVIDDEEVFARRFREGRFPALETKIGGEVVRRCWMGGYASASEVVKDLEELEGELINYHTFKKIH